MMLLQILRNWVWLQRSQWMGKERLAEIQARKLREIVNHAFRKVPFYRRLYDSAGVDPSGITNTESIDKLPIITKQHLRNVPLDERMAVGTDLSLCAFRTTSGSTGAPITILQDPHALSYRVALVLRRLWAYGIRHSHKILIAIPGPEQNSLFSSSKGLWGFVMKRKVRPLSLAADMYDHMTLILKWKPDVIEAPPSYFKTLIAFSEGIGKSLSLKVAISTGEILDDSTRALISNSLYTEVFDNYGLAEVGGVAWECPTHSGYHINADLMVAEFLRDGESVATSQPGELCLTSLYRKATPMIRYLSGDIATLIDDECPCGRGLPLMKNIQGRVVDFILLGEGRFISPHTVMYMLEGVPGVVKYKVFQRGDRSIELLVIATERKAELVQVLQQRCRKLFGDLPVSIKLVDRIEDSKDKFRVVESQLTR